MNTGLPRKRTVSCVPTATPETSTRIWLSGLHVGGRVHLVDEGPDGRACDDNAGAGGGVVQKVAAGARLVFCV
jgi:hypothetical protein